MWVVNLVVRTAELDQLQGSHETKGQVGSLQLIQQGFSDNQIDHKLILAFIIMLYFNYSILGVYTL